MPRIPVILLALALATLAAPRAASGQYVRPAAGKWGITLEGHALSGFFDPGVAGLDYTFASRGWGLGVAAGLVYQRHVLLGAEGGAVFFAGDRMLPQLGQADYKGRTTHSLVGSLYAGLISPALNLTPALGRRWWVGANVGRSKWDGARDVADCNLCTHERLRMRAGPYAEPFVILGVGDKDAVTGFRVAHRVFLADYARMRNATLIGLHIELRNLN